MRNRVMEKCELVKCLEKKVGTVLFTVLLVLLMLALIPMKVSGSGDMRVSEEESYHELEMCFLEVLDMRLQEYGYTHCGLTLNSIVDGNGERSYCVRIHHARITDAGAEAWEELKQGISDLSFPVENCSVAYEIVP